MLGRNLRDNWGYLTRPDCRFEESSPLYVAAGFLAEATGNYVDANLEYRDKIGANDFPFYSGEFQNQAIFYKAMSDVCKTDCLAFPEHPYQYKRRYANAEKHRLDYWALLRSKGRDDTVLLAEYKHVYVDLRQRGTCDKDGYLRGHFANTAGLRDGWWENGKTLKELGDHVKRNKGLKADMSSWDGCNRDIVRANLITVPIEMVSTREEKVRNATISKEEMRDWRKELTELMKPVPNWSRHWWLGTGSGQHSQEADYWKDKGQTYYYKYFGAFFFARLDVL